MLKSDFIKKVELKYPNKFSFEEIPLEFSSREKIKINCLKHGLFEILPYRFINLGCPKCRPKLLGNNTKINLESFILRANQVHNNKYDYSEVKFNRITDKVKINCLKHGSFNQKGSNHLSGQGCPLCGKETRNKKNSITKEELYSYPIFSDTNIRLIKLPEIFNFKIKLEFNCLKHGIFKKNISNLALGQKCPKCSVEKQAAERTYSESEFVNLINSKNIQSKFKYVPESYTKMQEYVLFVCPEHGQFKVNHAYQMVANQSNCPKCKISNFQRDIISYIESFHIKYLINYRPDFLNGKEIDIFFPEYNFGIECNGAYWHSIEFKNKYYHFDKTKLCLENNINLLHIWDFYWNIKLKKEIYKSKIKHFLKMDNRVYARKCKILPIEKNDAISFIRENHLEGMEIPYAKSSYIGLYYDNHLLMVGIYGYFYSQPQKSFKWKLQRIATKQGYTIIGGVSKITNHIKNQVGDFQFQITLDTGGSLAGLFGDRILERNNISLRYWWINSNLEFKTRNQTQVSILKENSDWNINDTEVSYMNRNGWFKVFDSGILEIN